MTMLDLPKTLEVPVTVETVIPVNGEELYGATYDCTLEVKAWPDGHWAVDGWTVSLGWPVTRPVEPVHLPAPFYSYLQRSIDVHVASNPGWRARIEQAVQGAIEAGSFELEFEDAA